MLWLLIVIFAAPAVLAVGLLAYALCKVAAQPAPPVPPTRPLTRARRVDIDLDEIDWDWRLS